LTINHLCALDGVLAVRAQVTIEQFALPIKKLNGTDPVGSLDFSGKDLKATSAIMIGSLIAANGSLTSLDLSSNFVGPELGVA
jgi:hypothetical protein